MKDDIGVFSTTVPLTSPAVGMHEREHQDHVRCPVGFTSDPPAQSSPVQCVAWFDLLLRAGLYGIGLRCRFSALHCWMEYIQHQAQAIWFECLLRLLFDHLTIFTIIAIIAIIPSIRPKSPNLLSSPRLALPCLAPSPRHGIAFQKVQLTGELAFKDPREFQQQGSDGPDKLGPERVLASFPSLSHVLLHGTNTGLIGVAIARRATVL